MQLGIPWVKLPISRGVDGMPRGTIWLDRTSGSQGRSHEAHMDAHIACEALARPLKRIRAGAPDSQESRIKRRGCARTWHQFISADHPESKPFTSPRGWTFASE